MYITAALTALPQHGQRVPVPRLRHRLQGRERAGREPRPRHAGWAEAVPAHLHVHRQRQLLQGRAGGVQPPRRRGRHATHRAGPAADRQGGRRRRPGHRPEQGVRLHRGGGGLRGEEGWQRVGERACGVLQPPRAVHAHLLQGGRAVHVLSHEHRVLGRALPASADHGADAGYEPRGGVAPADGGRRLVRHRRLSRVFLPRHAGAATAPEGAACPLAVV